MGIYGHQPKWACNSIYQKEGVLSSTYGGPYNHQFKGALNPIHLNGQLLQST